MAQKVEIEIRLDNRNFAEGANKVKAEISGIALHAESEGGRMGSVFDNLGKKVAGAFAVSKLVEFEKMVISVRSEMESLQRTFESLAGEQAGRKLYEDIRQLATSTPMMMNDLAKGAQTLLGFNIEAEKVMPILRQIGDISMGGAQKFNSLTLAFAQTSSTGKLMGQDLLQMINAGFNPLVVMAEKSGKSVDQLKDEMSKGLITVEMVEDAFRTATAEGGKFHNMMEKNSKTMRGAISNFEGAWQDMFNDIGEKQQGLMLGGIDLAQSLVKNYEKVGQVLLGIISTYGVYKAAVIAVTLAERTANGQRMLTVKWLKAMETAQKLLNRTMLLNPYVLAATALGVLVGAIIAAREGLTDADRAQRDYNKTLEDARQRQKEYNDETQDAIRLAQDDSVATEDREGAMQTLISRYPEIIRKYIDEKGHLTDILSLKREIAAFDRQTANEDNKINADLYKKYVDVINKWKRGEKLTETERILYDSANKRYSDATPWYSQFSGSWADDSIDYFTALWKQARHAYGRGKTEARVSDFMEKMGDMETDELKRLAGSLSTSLSKIKGDNQAVKVGELNDWLNSTDIQGLITKANGIIDARTKPKKGLTDKEKAAAQKEAEKAAEQRQRLFEIERKLAEEQAKMDRELGDALTDLAIANEGSNARREVMQQEKGHRDRLNAINRQAEEWKKAAYKAAEERFNATNTDKTKVFSDTEEGKAGWKGQSLTEEQKAIIEAREKEEKAIHERAVQERFKKEAQAMYDYLKEYGSIQQQREAITAEYDQKIADEGNAVQKAALEQQKQRLISELNFKELQQSIDWEAVFNDLERQGTEALRSLKVKLEQALDARDITVENAKILAEKIRETEDIIARRTDLWSSWIPGLRERQRLTLEVLETEKEIQGLQTASDTAGARQEDALKNFTSMIGIDPENFRQQFGEINADSLKVVESFYNIDTSSQAVRDAFALLQTSTTDLGKSQEDLKQAREDREQRQNALKNFTKGGTISQYFKEVTAGMDFTGYVGLVNQNAQSMADLVDKVGLAGTDFGDAVHGFADGVGGFQSAITSLASGDVFGAVNGVIDGLAGFGSMIDSIGGGFLFGDDEEYRKALDKWQWVLESWKDTIDYQRELMEDAYGVEAIKTVEEMRSVLEQTDTAIKEIAKGWLHSGAGLLSSSNAHNVNEDIDWKALDDEFAKRLGVVRGTVKSFLGEFTINSGDVSRLFDLDWKELEKLKHSNYQFWDSIHDEVKNYLEEIIEAGKVAESVEQQFMEKMTTTTEQNMFDGFLSSLYDLADESEGVFDDIAGDWQKMVNKMLIDNVVGNQFQSNIKSLYKRLSDAMNERSLGGSNVDFQSAIEGIKDDYDKYMTQAQEQIEELRRAGLIMSGSEAVGQQSATTEAMQRITVDQADELIGRMNAGQIIWQHGNNQRDLIIQGIATMKEVVTGGGRHLGEMVTLMQTANGHLEDIVDYSKKMYKDFGGLLNEVITQIKKSSYA